MRHQFPLSRPGILRCFGGDRTVPVDPKEAGIDNRFYGELGDRWWEPDGPLSPLHEMTPVRSAYFDAVFATVLGKETIAAGRFVDIGCGGGIVTEEMARRGYPITGVDISAGVLAAAARHAARAGIRIPYRQASAYDTGIPSGRMEGAIASDIFEHLHDLPRAVAEISRILRPGGVLVFDTVNRTWLSLLGAVGVVQNWLRLLPPHTHNWKLFITPRELTLVLRRFGLEMREIRGLSPVAHPLRLLARLLQGRGFGPFTLSRDLRISYMGYAVKEESGPAASGKG